MSAKKSKGYNGEMWVVKWLQTLGIQCNRTYGSGAFGYVDDELDGDVRSELGKIEVKTWSKPLPKYLLDALKQGDGMMVYMYAQGQGYAYKPYVICERERFERVLQYVSE